MDQDDDGASGDARLVAGLRRRTPDAFAGLHDQYAVGIYNLALRMVRHAPDAEDITQDVLIRAYERVPQDRDVLLRPWLYRLTLNRCYDHLRAAKRRPVSHAAAPDLPSPHDLFEESDLQRRIEMTLDDLTRRQRAALLLKDVHGLSLVEVAVCLELTPGSVEVLLARARRAFRASFRAGCVEEGRSEPRAAGALAALPALPFLSLPASLSAPPLPALLPIPSAGIPPIAAAGSGIGAAIALPASFKTAALIIAAAATVGTAEVAATHGDGRRLTGSPAAASLVGGPAPVVSHAGAGRVASPRPRASASHRAKAISPPSPTPTFADAPSPSATPSGTATPSPTETPLGISSPTSTPVETPSVLPPESPSPSPSATPVF